MNVRDCSESGSLDIDEGMREQVSADGLDDVLDLRGATDDASLRPVTHDSIADPCPASVGKRLAVSVLGLHVLAAAVVVDERPTRREPDIAVVAHDLDIHGDSPRGWSALVEGGVDLLPPGHDVRVGDPPGLNQRSEPFPDHIVWRALGVDLSSSEVEQRPGSATETAIVHEYVRHGEAVSRPGV